MLFAHGHWTEFDIDDKLGSKTPGPTNWGDEQSVLMMQKFKELADVSHPDNLANGTLQLNTVYQAGQIAMQVQYHEFAASIEDEKTSRARPAARPPTRRARRARRGWIDNGGKLVNGCNCGIGGIGINANASDDLKRAAYIFSIWATSQEHPVQRAEGRRRHADPQVGAGRSPRWQAARNRPTNMPNALTFAAVYDFGIKDPNFVLGPEDPGGQRVPPDHPGPKCRTASRARRRPRRPARRSSRRPTT